MAGKTRIRFIINPKAGRGLATAISRMLPEVLPSSGFDTEVCLTTAPGHAAELSREAVALRFDVVVAVGGDGTINEAAQPLSHTEVALGMVPAGSGNGFARHFGIPMDARRALRVVAEGNTVSIDSLLVNGRFCLNMAGAGFDAFIARRFAGLARRGFLSYMKLVARHYFQSGETTYRLRFDGNDLQVRALLVELANGSQFGNGARIAPEADPSDGLLDLVILKKIPWYLIPSALARLFRGRPMDGVYYSGYRTASVHLSSDEPAEMHIDGEPAGTGRSMEARVRPATNRVIVPAR